MVHSPPLGGDTYDHSQSWVCLSGFLRAFAFVLTIFQHMVVKRLEDRTDFSNLHLRSPGSTKNIYTSFLPKNLVVADSTADPEIDAMYPMFLFCKSKFFAIGFKATFHSKTSDSTELTNFK